MYTLDRRDVGEGLYASLLQKRQYYDCDRYGNCRQTSWSSWGRWVALVIILITALIFFFLCALLSARRRRRRGLYPIWGTAWVPGSNPVTYHKKNNNWQYDPDSSVAQPGEPNPPPLYTPPAGNYYAPPPGPPPGQYEMQSPYFTQGQHNGTGEQYSPPAGPPPGVREPESAAGEQFAPPSNPPPAHLHGGKA